MPKRGKRANSTGRSEGDPRHVRLHRYLLESIAYRALSPLGRACLVELYSLFNGSNNGDLHPGVRWMAMRLNVAPNTACKAFSEVQQHGFARPRELGAFTRKDRKATTWILTEFEFAGQLPTKDFMRWSGTNQKQKSVANSDLDGRNSCDGGASIGRISAPTVANPKTYYSNTRA